ncbi:hypothetical protein AWE51_14860 [Aquimarina aggregata]|uniref:Uncharacterized protein n=1 Tax=Aquimarina aggregata TaxID=1642818 RepID=A0A162XZW7_9FLAO|nr:hypothetical protein [Aquimarina aggregata]KZS38859.1 hypothetical protein AWE51_14860 [Aquimarina aggregata]
MRKKKKKYIFKALSWVEKRPTTIVKSIAEGYENPKTFTSKSTNEKIQADLAFTTYGGAKHYSIIALKNNNIKKLVVKWKVLSFMAGIKRGKLHLLAPKGHKAFTKRLIERHNINAVVYTI